MFLDYENEKIVKVALLRLYEAESPPEFEKCIQDFIAVLWREGGYGLPLMPFQRRFHRALKKHLGDTSSLRYFMKREALGHVQIIKAARGRSFVFPAPDYREAQRANIAAVQAFNERQLNSELPDRDPAEIWKELHHDQFGYVL